MWKRYAKVGLIVFCVFLLVCFAKREEEKKGLLAEIITTNDDKIEVNSFTEEFESEEPVIRLEFNPIVRVVISDASFQGIIHKDVLVTSSKPYDLLSPEGELFAEYKAGETIAFSSFRMQPGESLVLASKEAERFSVDSLSRAQGVPFYRGKLQIYKEENGYVIVNELPLEEYLLSVVPSEMPSSYPAQALAAQAVCARSYAYSFLNQPGYPQYDAHMDDSTSYQVYNNIEETEETTAAIKNTEGAVMLKDGVPVSTYFFSTSCGVTSNENVWSLKNNLKEVTFLPVAVSDAKEDSVAVLSQGEQKPLFDAQNLCEEETFSAFISNVDMNSLEAEEQWYRWVYKGKISAKNLFDKLESIYQEKPEAVLTKENETYISKEPKEFQSVFEISVQKRLPGGVADELLIETEDGCYLVKSEYYIRKVLADKSGVVTRNDQSRVEAMGLLPSAYFVVELKRDKKENVNAIVLTGGGYGHGVGMSQNGAKTAALKGMSWDEILNFFYSNLELCIIEK